jgi:hypothetical protein
MQVMKIPIILRAVVSAYIITPGFNPGLPEIPTIQRAVGSAYIVTPGFNPGLPETLTIQRAVGSGRHNHRTCKLIYQFSSKSNGLKSVATMSFKPTALICINVLNK